MSAAMKAAEVGGWTRARAIPKRHHHAQLNGLSLRPLAHLAGPRLLPGLPFGAEEAIGSCYASLKR